MKKIRLILGVVLVLVAVPALVRAADATSTTPAPAKPAVTPPRAPTLVSVTADDPDFAAGAAPEAPAAASAPLTASAAIDPARMIPQIQSTPLAQREALVAEIGSRISAAQRALVTLRARVTAPGQRNGNAFVFQSTLTQARNTEHSLRKILQAAKASATPAAWANTQTALVRSYGDYAKAVADVEAVWHSPVTIGR